MSGARECRRDGRVGGEGHGCQTREFRLHCGERFIKQRDVISLKRLLCPGSLREQTRSSGDKISYLKGP